MVWVVIADLENGHQGFTECNTEESAEETRDDWMRTGLANGISPIRGNVEILKYNFDSAIRNL